MGALQRTPGKAPTAFFSQDYPRLRRRERISLVKKPDAGESGTSGSVRGGGGNVLPPTRHLSALTDRGQVTLEGIPYWTGESQLPRSVVNQRHVTRQTDPGAKRLSSIHGRSACGQEADLFDAVRFGTA